MATTLRKTACLLAPHCFLSKRSRMYLRPYADQDRQGQHQHHIEAAGNPRPLQDGDETEEQIGQRYVECDVPERKEILAIDVEERS